MFYVSPGSLFFHRNSLSPRSLGYETELSTIEPSLDIYDENKTWVVFFISHSICCPSTSSCTPLLPLHPSHCTSTTCAAHFVLCLKWRAEKQSTVSHPLLPKKWQLQHGQGTLRSLANMVHDEAQKKDGDRPLLSHFYIFHLFISCSKTSEHQWNNYFSLCHILRSCWLCAANGPWLSAFQVSSVSMEKKHFYSCFFCCSRADPLLPLDCLWRMGTELLNACS